MKSKTVHDIHPADRPDVNRSLLGADTAHRSDHLPPPMLTAPEAARFLRVRAPQIYALARDGTIPSVRVGRAVRFDRDRLLRWIDGGGAIAAGTPK
jgi:excisionase family DNA binding protein